MIEYEVGLGIRSAPLAQTVVLTGRARGTPLRVYWYQGVLGYSSLPQGGVEQQELGIVCDLEWLALCNTLRSAASLRGAKLHLYN